MVFRVTYCKTLVPHFLSYKIDYMLKVTHEIVNADGTPLIVQGRGSFIIELGTQKLCCKDVVADVKVDGILHLDFLQSNTRLIDVRWKRMYINGLEHRLQLY